MKNKHLILLLLLTLFYAACCPDDVHEKIPDTHKFKYGVNDTFIYKSNWENIDTFVITRYREDKGIREEFEGMWCHGGVYFDILEVKFELLNDSLNRKCLLLWSAPYTRFVSSWKDYHYPGADKLRYYGTDTLIINDSIYYNVSIRIDTINTNEFALNTFYFNDKYGIIEYDYKNEEKYILHKIIKN